MSEWRQFFSRVGLCALWRLLRSCRWGSNHLRPHLVQVSWKPYQPRCGGLVLSQSTSGGPCRQVLYVNQIVNRRLDFRCLVHGWRACSQKFQSNWAGGFWKNRLIAFLFVKTMMGFLTPKKDKQIRPTRNA